MILNEALYVTRTHVLDLPRYTRITTFYNAIREI